MNITATMNKFDPAGFVDLSDLDDGSVEGIASAARGSQTMKTIGCCWCLPWYSSWTKCGTICSTPSCV